jgi:hypothetical protein
VYCGCSHQQVPKVDEALNLPHGHNKHESYVLV